MEIIKRRALIIDRDGTIITEPPIDYQIDSLEKLEFVPSAISSLAMLSNLDYEFVMASNQDGLGTSSFPEDTFWGAQNKMMKTLEGEGITFDDVLIDKSFEEENAPTRKPRTGMFSKYMTPEYDLAGSFVIGDRVTDIILAKNLGAKGILMQKPEVGVEMLESASCSDVCCLISDDWTEIAEYIRCGARTATVVRDTRETKISSSIDLDGRGNSNIDTGLNFLNHMIEQIVHHAGVSLELVAKGDLHVDEHHTMEDVAIVLGELVSTALGDKRGIERYGYALPMDECRALVVLDFGGRIDFDWRVEFSREMVGDVPTEMFSHFFKSFSQSAKCNLHIEATGENDHHKIEGVFKAFARSLKRAIKRDAFKYELPSSKGVL